MGLMALIHIAAALYNKVLFLLTLSMVVLKLNNKKDSRLESILQHNSYTVAKMNILVSSGCS